MTKIVNFMLSAYYHNEQHNKDNYFHCVNRQSGGFSFVQMLFYVGGTLRKDLGIHREEDRTKKWTYALVSLATEKVRVGESHG